MVASEPNGEVQISKHGAPTDETTNSLWVLETEQTSFWQRVDGEDLCPRLLGRFERREHARVVAARVLSSNHDEVGEGKIFETDRTLPDSDCFFEGERRWFVAHVGAVGQIVGTKTSGKKLIGERRFVARSARRVEHRLIRVFERSKVSGNEPERLVP